MKKIIEFTNLSKIFFPAENITKQQIIDYYQNIASFLIPLAKNHLIVIRRFPDGIEHEGFYQKQASDYFPSWIKTKKIALKKGGTQTLLLLNKQQDLTYLANQGVIEFHSWLSTTKTIQKPDKIVFDLDPDNNTLKELHIVARSLKKTLEEHRLIPFIMTTGSRGYHIVVPIKPQHSFETIHNFAKQIAQTVAQQYSEICVATVSKATRKNKIFIDYLRNSYGQTSIAPYSLRALAKAPIATPIDWNDLSKTPPQKYTLKNIFKRLIRKHDPWKNLLKSKKTVKI